MQETVQNMGKAVCRVRRSEGRVVKSGCEAPGLEKRQRLDGGREYFMREGFILFLEQMVEATDTEGTGLLLENEYGRMVVEPFRKESLPSLAECLKECVMVRGRHLYDRGAPLKLVEWGL